MTGSTRLGPLVLGALLALQGDDISFRQPRPAPGGSYAPVILDGRTVAVDLFRGLPGLPPAMARFRFPLAEPVDYLEVLVGRAGRGSAGASPQIACTVIVAGGVRAPLTYHLLPEQGDRVSIVFPGGRLLQGFLRPILDSRAAALACLFENRRGIQLRVLSVLGRRPALLLARTLERPPERLALRQVLGEPRTRVLIGPVAFRVPGEREWDRSGVQPMFLHPLAALPELSAVRLDFGSLERGDRVTRSFTISNPGRLTLRLRLRAPEVRGWRMDLLPSSLTLPAGEQKSVQATLSCGKPPPRLAGRLEIAGISGEGDPLAQLALSARGVRQRDGEGPVLDAKVVEERLLPGRRVRLVGRRGAVTDANGPCKIGALTGEETVAAADGSFTLVAPLNLERRVWLWTEDRLGNRSKPRPIGPIQDERPPVWVADRVEMGLPSSGTTRVAGAAGAVRDATPPLAIEVEVDGHRRSSRYPVRPDGSFSFHLEAAPGVSVRLFALDGAQPLNRSRPLPLGRVLPYVARDGESDLVLHGPAGAGFRIAVTLPATAKAPETPLRLWRGELDASGKARIPRRALEGGGTLRFAVGVPHSRRVLTGTYPLEPPARSRIR